MKRLLFLGLMGLAALFFSSCTQHSGNHKRVVVLHSYGNEGSEGRPFRHYMKERFRDLGVDAEIHHLYLNLVRELPSFMEVEHQQEYADSLRKWNPEILLVNGDAALRWLTKTTTEEQPSPASTQIKQLFTQVPVVLAGINVLDRGIFNMYSNVTGFEDLIDVQKNLQIALQISGGQSVTIELDNNDYDAKLKKQIFSQISDARRYINNSDFHIDAEDSKALKKNYPGIPVVNFLSAYEPETNRQYTSDLYTEEEAGREDGIQRFRRYLDICKEPNQAQLQVKYDIFSNTFIQHSMNPQFTCIRHQFDEENRYILGGFFSSMETQINDQVNYAAQILEGATPKSLPLTHHEKDYYLDYKAMKLYKPESLHYDDWKNRFHIINAPFPSRHPILHGFLVILVLLLLLALLSFLCYRIVKLYMRTDRKYIKELKKENERRNLTLASADAHLWYIDNGELMLSNHIVEKYHLEKKQHLASFRHFVLPDSLASLETLYDYALHKGKNKIRLHLSWDGTQENTHWYEMIYQVDNDNISQKRIMGISVQIDDIVETEQRLNDIQHKINESDQKQSFLNSISHDLRTPLNAVTGFAQLITSPDLEFSPEELSEFNIAIHENSDLMKKMITSVIEQSENYDNDLVVKPLKSSASLFVKRVYQTHQILVPTHLNLIMEQDSPDRAIYIDPNKTRLVLNNFVGNAFKFTPSGHITIGWKYLPETEEVLIYCKDTGVGLSPEDQERVFERYYKAQETDKGTGLGLNISRTLIENQGGIIGVESELGKGSTFWFKFKEYKGE